MKTLLILIFLLIAGNGNAYYEILNCAICGKEIEHWVKEVSYPNFGDDMLLDYNSHSDSTYNINLDYSWNYVCKDCYEKYESIFSEQLDSLFNELQEEILGINKTKREEAIKAKKEKEKLKKQKEIERLQQELKWLQEGDVSTPSSKLAPPTIDQATLQKELTQLDTYQMLFLKAQERIFDKANKIGNNTRTRLLKAFLELKALSKRQAYREFISIIYKLNPDRATIFTLDNINETDINWLYGELVNPFVNDSFLGLEYITKYVDKIVADYIRASIVMRMIATDCNWIATKSGQYDRSL